jgi:exonuclease VII large subunit
MKRILVALGVLLVLLLFLIAGLLTAVRPDVDVPLEIAKGLITLAVAVLVTGVLSFILAERNRELALHEERVRVLAAARQDFKAAYEQVHTARFFLKVHPSAKTLDEQISTLNDARERLQRVQRERFIRENQQTDGAIQGMLDYLRSLTGEYGENYLYLTCEKLAEEAEHKKILNGDDIELKERSLLSDPRFAALAAFVADQQYRSSNFAKGYQVVKVWLDRELSR